MHASSVVHRCWLSLLLSANEYRRSACHACERRRPTVHEKRYVTAMYRVYLHPRALTPRSRTQGTAPQSSLCPDGCLPLLLSRKNEKLTVPQKEKKHAYHCYLYDQSEINENTHCECLIFSGKTFTQHERKSDSALPRLEKVPRESPVQKLLCAVAGTTEHHHGR